MRIKKKKVEMWKRGRLGEKQLELRRFTKKMYPQKKLEVTRHLETERENFPSIMNDLVEMIDINESKTTGRPSLFLKDMIKCLLIKTHNNLSYRRSESDIEMLYRNGLINSMPKRSALNKYMMDNKVKEMLQQLINLSAKFFIDNENTLLIDSTWLSKKMGTRNYEAEKGHINPFEKTRKIHVACLKDSRIIACAICTNGNANDSPYFEHLLKNVMDSGFNIKTVLADAGYSSRLNYALCDACGIEEVYIDFKKNASTKNSKGRLWKQKLMMYKNNFDAWHDQYRYRVLIESVFSSIKRKQINYIRNRKDISQDVELLLKILCHNIGIINRELYGHFE